MKLRVALLSLLKIYLIPLIGLLVITFFYAGCNEEDNSYNTPPPSSNPNTVSILYSSFNPGNKTVSVGTKVTWTNNDNIAHTVTSGTPGNPSGLFNSGNIAPGGTFEFTFSQAGEFNYFCNIHQSMTAKVTVQ